ncbi:MAG: flagellar basal body P-ring formation chaperone FlgA [Phycisphaerae bacterium]
MTRTITGMAVLLTGVAFVAAGDTSGTSGGVELYLPREITVESAKLSLGQITLVDADTDATESTIRKIAMGRAPWTRESITFDRATILARLASAGIDAEKVTFRGAKSVTVKRKETIVSGEKITTAAKTYLDANRPRGEGVFWKVTRTADDQTVQTSEAVKLQAALAKDPPDGYVKVTVSVMAGKKALKTVDVLFKLGYVVRKVVAARDISAGDAFTTDNVKVAEVESVRPAEGPFAPPLGMVASHNIRKGLEIRDNLVRAPKQAVVVKRGQGVEMRVEGKHFAVRAAGQALEDGKPGQFIKVRNIDTKRIVVGKVMPDGYVMPVVKK